MIALLAAEAEIQANLWGTFWFPAFFAASAVCMLVGVYVLLSAYLDLPMLRTLEERRGTSPTATPQDPGDVPPRGAPLGPEVWEAMDESEARLAEVSVPSPDTLRAALLDLLSEGRQLRVVLTTSTLDNTVRNLGSKVQEWSARVDHRLEGSGMPKQADQFRRAYPMVSPIDFFMLAIGNKAFVARRIRRTVDLKSNKLREIVRGLPPDKPSDLLKTVTGPSPSRYQIVNDMLDELAQAELRISRARQTGRFSPGFEIPTVAWTKHRLSLDTELPQHPREILGHCYAALVELRNASPAGREVRADDRLNEVAYAIGAARRALQATI